MRVPLVDFMHLGAFGRVGRDEPREPAGLRPEAHPGVPPRVEEPLLAGDHEAALAGLEVEHKRLDKVRLSDHLLRMPGVMGRVPKAQDREEQGDSDRGDGDAHKRGADEHAGRQTVWQQGFELVADGVHGRPGR